MHQVHHFPFYLDPVYIDQYHFIEGALNQHGIGTGHAYLAGADDCAFTGAAHSRGRSRITIGSKETIHHIISTFLSQHLFRYHKGTQLQYKMLR